LKVNPVSCPDPSLTLEGKNIISHYSLQENLFVSSTNLSKDEDAFPEEFVEGMMSSIWFLALIPYLSVFIS